MPKYTKRKDGRYHTSVGTGEINPETGKKIRIPVYGRTIAELERNKAEAIDQISKGIYISNKAVTFCQYKWQWLELYVVRRIR